MTYLLYIDESYDSKSDYIIMAGFGVHINNWKKIDTNIRKLKSDYFFNSSMNLKSIRRNRFDDYKYWKNLSSEKKKTFNEEFYNIICIPNNLILAALINKNSMNKKNKNLYFHLAYGFIIQRFQYFLSEKKESGVIIMHDAKNSEEIKNLYQSHVDFLSEGVPTSRKDSIIIINGIKKSIKDYERSPINNICENLIFLDDTNNNMLQIVDMIVAAISAKYNRLNNTWFEKLKSIIRCDSAGNFEGYGIKFFPRKE